MNYARAQLKAIPGLADRMGSLMGITSMWILNSCYFDKMVFIMLLN